MNLKYLVDEYKVRVWTNAAWGDPHPPPHPPLLSGGLQRGVLGGEGRVKTVNRAGCSHCFPAANRDRLFLTQ
jgi:hypothetical protein